MLDIIVGHVGEGAPSRAVRIAVGAGAGLLAAVLLTPVLRRLREGHTPAYLTASLLTGESPATVSARIASLVHYASGTLAGVGFTMVAESAESVFPSRLLITNTGLPLIPHLVAGGAVFSVLFILVGYGVVPVTTERVTARPKDIRNHWAISAGAFTATVVVLIPLLTLIVD
jgi:hypothetical protein